MKHTLGTAAKATGKAKSTILRAIEDGRISANRTESGHYAIDPAELHRVFPPTATQQAPSNDTQSIEEHPATLGFQVKIMMEERERERSHMQATIDDLRDRLDRSEARVTALLTAPPRKPFWWWGR